MSAYSSHNLAGHRGRTSTLALGSAAVYFGAAILLIAACETFGGGGLALPRFWYVNRTLWIGLGFVSMLAGTIIQSRVGDGANDGWRPTEPGRRFEQVIVYSKDGCHLCEAALDLLRDAQYRPYIPMPEEVDITVSPELQAAYGMQIPVVEFDGRIRFRGRVNEVLLRRLIEGTPPLGSV